MNKIEYMRKQKALKEEHEKNILKMKLKKWWKKEWIKKNL